MAIAQEPSESSVEIYFEAQDWLDRLQSEPDALVLPADERRQLTGLLGRMLDRLDRAETIESVRKGLEQSEKGLGRDAREVFAELRQKLKIPDSY